MIEAHIVAALIIIVSALASKLSIIESKMSMLAALLVKPMIEIRMSNMINTSIEKWNSNKNDKIQSQQ